MTAETLAAALQATTANLAAHIEQRAAELADPRIAEAERLAAERVAALAGTYEFDRRRWADLEAELRRQLDAQIRLVERHRAVLTANGVDLMTGRPKFNSTPAPTTAGRGSVMSWECNQKPDLERLAEMVGTLSGGTLHLAEVPDTGTDEYALVVATVPLDEARAQALYRRWWVPDDPDGDRLDVLDVAG